MSYCGYLPGGNNKRTSPSLDPGIAGEELQDPVGYVREIVSDYYMLGVTFS
jgi:hypothetical protein